MVGWRKRVKSDDFSLRLVALFLAVILWFVATERPQRNLGLDERQVTVELVLANVDQEVEISQVPDTVEVTLEGPRLVLPFQVHEAIAKVNLGGLGPGTHNVPVHVDLPTGITLKQVRPQEVRVVLETRARRPLPVSVAVDSVPPGTLVQVGAVVPASAEVFGPSSAVAKVQALVARVSYGTDQTQARVTPVGADGGPVEGVVVSPNVVEVNLER